VQQSQRNGDNSNENNNQQIQASGDVGAPYAASGGVSFTGDNHGIVVTSFATKEEPQHTFNIPKKTRIPTPASLIGTVSGLTTLLGFVTGGFSVKQLVDIATAGTDNTLMGSPPSVHWWLLGSLLTVAVGVFGLTYFRFLSRNVLRLPKWWVLRAWAGIKEEGGRTYPYSLRLAMRCPQCTDTNLRFQQVPAKWVDFYDSKGAHKKRTVTDWESMAVCHRDKNHSLRVNISGNDFDEAVSR